MSRKMTLRLAATGTLAMATLTSQSADAGFRGIAGRSLIGGSAHTPARVTPFTRFRSTFRGSRFPRAEPRAT
jgi:hypothetical protein